MKIKYKFQSTFLILLLTAGFIFTSCDMPTQATSNYLNESESVATEMAKDNITDSESDGLMFMREEEKLARDVYLMLYEMWNRSVFVNIASSEQNHMDAIKVLLDRYEIADPVGVDSIGVFKNVLLQGLYVTLVEQGNASLVDALKVGALIEEIDVLDIQTELDEHVENQDVIFVYENLLKGSRNHLRAFVRNLSRQGIEYAPQKLSDEQYLLIISNNQERGRK